MKASIIVGGILFLLAITWYVVIVKVVWHFIKKFW